MKQGFSILVLLLSFFSSTPLKAQDLPSGEPILFLGSSTMEFWGPRLRVDFPGLNILDLGAGGSKFNYLLENAESWIRLHPNARTLVIYSGDNDVADGASASRVLSDASQLIQIFHRKLPRAHLYLMSVKICPDRTRFTGTIRNVNESFKALVQGRSYLTYVDVASSLLDANGSPIRDYFRQDGVHLSDSGYAKWARILSPLLHGQRDFLR